MSFSKPSLGLCPVVKVLSYKVKDKKRCFDWFSGSGQL